MEIVVGIKWLMQSSISGIGGSWWLFVPIGFVEEDWWGILEMEVISGSGQDVIVLFLFSLLA